MPWWSELICEQYPPVTVFETDRVITISEMRRFVRIILSEGTPFAFAKCPMAFEFGRERAAFKIGIDAKQMSMTGSGRLGYSLSPHKFGRVYDPTASDIDLFVIDHDTFSAAAQEYRDFIDQFEAGRLTPRHAREETYWTQAKSFVPSNIKKGFIDQKYIPTFDRFPMSQRLGEANFSFLANVNSVAGARIVKATSLRVYRSWDKAVNQISFSLMAVLKTRANANPHTT